MKRFFKALFLFLAGGGIVAVAVANRHPVRFVVDPFINRDLAYSVEAPLYFLLFSALFAGLLIGGIAVWASQGRWRKMARHERKEAVLWKREAETLKRGLQSGAGSALSAQAEQRPLRSVV